MGRYRVAVPGDIAGALRTLSSLEHTLLTLDPSRDLVSAARLAMPGVLRRLAAPEQLAGQAAPDAVAAAAIARRLPGRLEQLTDQLVRGEPSGDREIEVVRVARAIGRGQLHAGEPQQHTEEHERERCECDPHDPAHCARSPVSDGDVDDWVDRVHHIGHVENVWTNV